MFKRRLNIHFDIPLDLELTPGDAKLSIWMEQPSDINSEMNSYFVIMTQVKLRNFLDLFHLAYSRCLVKMADPSLLHVNLAMGRYKFHSN